MFAISFRKFKDAAVRNPWHLPKRSCPKKLLAAIQELIARDDVQSVSSDFIDYWFWRILVEEQLRRCELAGQKEPQSAFALSGPDGEDGNVPFSDWGGYVAPPYGNRWRILFIMPGWRHSFPESDAEGGMLTDILYPPRHGVAHEQCRFLMMGSRSAEMRAPNGNRRWMVSLYKSKRPYQPNLKFRNTLVNQPFGAPESSIQFEMGCEAYGSPLLPWRQYGYFSWAIRELRYHSSPVFQVEVALKSAERPADLFRFAEVSHHIGNRVVILQFQ